MTETRASVRSEVLFEGCNDFVSASWVYSLAIDAGVESEDDRRALAIGVIAELLALELMVAGGLSPAGFSAWESSSAEAISRVVVQWAIHGNEPISNEVVWLSITDRGRRTVELGAGS